MYIPGGGYSASYPSDIRAGAGYRIEKLGLALRIVADFTGVPLLATAPAAGHVLVQDPASGGFNRLDLSNLPTTVPRDASVTNSKFAAAPALTLKGNATSAMAQPQDIALSVLTQPGNPVGDAFAGKASLGHKTVADTDYSCTITDVQVGFTVLTASRTVSLPDVDGFPFGQDLVIADEAALVPKQCLSRSAPASVRTTRSALRIPTPTMGSPPSSFPAPFRLPGFAAVLPTCGFACDEALALRFRRAVRPVIRCAGPNPAPAAGRDRSGRQHQIWQRAEARQARGQQDHHHARYASDPRLRLNR